MASEFGNKCRWCGYGFNAGHAYDYIKLHEHEEVEHPVQWNIDMAKIEIEQSKIHSHKALYYINAAKDASCLDFKDQDAVHAEELLESGICPLCGEPVTDSDVHKTCMDREQYGGELASDEYEYDR